MKAEIKAEELMIGNILQYQNGTTLMQGRVTSIPNGNKICIDHIAVKINNLLPVKLTPWILEKCGLTDGVFHDIEYFSIAGLNSMPESYGLYYENDWTSVSIEYLHQLQNLYFCLTGAHLTVEL